MNISKESSGKDIYSEIFYSEIENLQKYKNIGI